MKKIKQLWLIIISIFFSFDTFAKCMEKKDKDLVSRSELIFIGKVTSTNINTSKKALIERCRKTGKRTLDLSYKIDLTTSMKGQFFTNGPFSLEYKYACMRKPGSVSFDKGQEYIFAVKSLKDGKLNLVGYSCGFWGWQKKEAKRIYKIIMGH